MQKITASLSQLRAPKRAPVDPSPVRVSSRPLTKLTKKGQFTLRVNANAECARTCFSYVRHWQWDADSNADAGKNQNLLDFIPGNVAVMLTLTRGVN